MVDSFSLAILIIVSIVLFVLIVFALWYVYHANKKETLNHEEEDSANHIYLTEKNLFRSSKKTTI